MLEVSSKLTDRHLVKKAPAPWKLSGEAIVLLYKFKKNWVENQGMLPKNLKGKFRGGLGLVILVNYTDSPVGSFQELVFMPGRFRKNKMQVITKLITDSEPNAINGQNNWGLPKEIHPILWQKAKSRDQVGVYHQERRLFSIEIEHGGIPIPVSTIFFPIHLCQTWNKLKFFSKPLCTGWGKLAKVKNLEIDPEYFPDIRNKKPLLALKVNPFNLEVQEAIFQDEEKSS